VFIEVTSFSWKSTQTPNEFQFNGTFGLGRPRLNDTTNFVTQAYLAGYLTSPTYAFEPSSVSFN
jgi:hypothetical protein